MKFSVATSKAPDTAQAAEEVTKGLLDALGSEADLLFIFASPHHADGLEHALPGLHERLGAPRLIGCTAESVIGGAVEYEGVPALAAWGASIPGVDIEASRIDFQQAPDGFFFTGTPEVPDLPSTLLLLADPYSFPADVYLKRCGEDFPHLQILGGMASAGNGPEQNRLFLGPAVHRRGAVAVLFRGGSVVRPLVSQGCRPFGRPFVITKAEKNAILALRGKPAMQVLRDQIGRLAPEERQLLAHGLHIGIAIDASKEAHARGDFLVRNVIGVNEASSAIFVTDVVRAGQTVQFHVRDAGTASEDLHILLRETRERDVSPSAALLFTCNGRGKRLFQASSHDAGAVTRELGDIPLAGFFAAGEIGPVGGRNFLHGFTASLALFG